MRKLIGFGYWRSLHGPTLPDPAWFIDASWSENERRQVAIYLSQGYALRTYMGFEWCRFRCGADAALLASSDWTDGTYCWPAELSHYVFKHNLRLPAELVQHILAQPIFPIEQARQVSPSCEVQLDWWCTQKGFGSKAQSYLSETDQEIRDFIRRYDQNKLFFEDYSEDGLRAVIRLAQELKANPLT